MKRCRRASGSSGIVSRTEATRASLITSGGKSGSGKYR
jgi:hypothetical protein